MDRENKHIKMEISMQEVMLMAGQKEMDSTSGRRELLIIVADSRMG